MIFSLNFAEVLFGGSSRELREDAETESSSDDLEILEIPVEDLEAQEDQGFLKTSEVLEIPVQTSEESSEVGGRSEALESGSGVQEGIEDRATSEESTEVRNDSEVLEVSVQTSLGSREVRDGSEVLESKSEVQEGSEDRATSEGSTEVRNDSEVLEVPVQTSEGSIEVGGGSEALESVSEVQDGSGDRATSEESTEITAESELLEVPVQASRESTEVGDKSEVSESASEVQGETEVLEVSVQTSEDLESSVEVAIQDPGVQDESEVLEIPVQTSEDLKNSLEVIEMPKVLETLSEVPLTPWDSNESQKSSKQTSEKSPEAQTEELLIEVQANLEVPVRTSGDPTEVQDVSESQKSSEVLETSVDSQEDSEVLDVPVQTSTESQDQSPPNLPLLKISIPTELTATDQQDSGLPPEPDFLPDFQWNLPDIATSTHCSFIKSESRAKCRKVLSQAASLPRVVAPAIFVVAEVKKVAIVPPKKRKVLKKMAAEVIHQNEPHCFSTTNVDRPFKLLVQKETFLIDADSMSRISPIFNLMCFGKDFEKMDLSREIVDEKSKDIDCFLRAVHDTSTINSTNFALVLRLSNKYQVETIIEACQQFILRQQLEVLKPDEILTMLIAAYEHHCQKDVVQKLIRRLASEGNTVFTKLRISRFLPAQVYGSVISTSMNLNQVREHETMNGHVLKLERSKTRWRQSVCDECKSVSECANCEECKKSYCRRHVADKKCSNDYGLKLLADLKKKIVDFEWTD